MASTDTADHPEPTRRDFIYIATGAVVAVGAALTVWPLIDQMNPDAAALALASIEVDVSSVTPGMSMTVKWRGKPVVIRRRTDAEVAEAQQVDVSTPARPGTPATPICPPTRRPPTPTARCRAGRRG